MSDELSSFFEHLKRAGLTPEERAMSRKAVQATMRDDVSANATIQWEIDRLASTLPTSALSLEEKRTISLSLRQFIDRTPASEPSPSSPPLFVRAWSGGNLLRSVRPFSLQH